MDKQACGTSGLVLPLLGVGCWSFGGGEGDYWGEQDQTSAEAVVHAALDAGANYFDTAEGYNEGRSEESLGRALKTRRQEAIIGTKVFPGNARPDLLRSHCEGSLRRLATDTIDLYMIHWPITDYPVGPAFETLADLQREGKIRYVGVSNFGVRQIREAAQAAAYAGIAIAANQLYYNLLSRAIEFEILPECQRLGIGIVGYMPLQQGLLTGKYYSADELPPVRTRTRHFSGDRPLARHGEPGAEEEVFQVIEALRSIAAETGYPVEQLALNWAARQPGVTCALTGVRNRAQLEEAVEAVSQPFPAELTARLTALTEPLKHQLGANADYFQGIAGSRVH